MSEKYFKRTIDGELIKWKNSDNRKPLLLLGASQVGKTSTIRKFGKQFDYMLEINFGKKRFQDTKPLFRSVFKEKLSLQQLFERLFSKYRVPVLPGKALLFLDNIHCCMPAFHALRQFYEKYPGLHIVATAPLMKNVPPHISTMRLFPFSFEEYLRATNGVLADVLQHASPENPFTEVMHNRYTQAMLRFMYLGGMPKVVLTSAAGGSLLECRQVLDELVLKLMKGFKKYKEYVPESRLRNVLATVVHQAGKKYSFTHAQGCAGPRHIRESVDLLEEAGIIHPVTFSSANELPLTADPGTKHRKYLILDTGIYLRFLNFDLEKILSASRDDLMNDEILLELFIGLELLKSVPNGRQLFYWQREKPGSASKLEYVLQCGADIVPIEINLKKETRGKQSIFLFLDEKKQKYGIRCSSENFGVYRNLKLYPYYAISQIVQP